MAWWQSLSKAFLWRQQINAPPLYTIRDVPWDAFRACTGRFVHGGWLKRRENFFLLPKTPFFFQFLVCVTGVQSVKAPDDSIHSP